jgi:hypothetical protein
MPLPRSDARAIQVTCYGPACLDTNLTSGKRADLAVEGYAMNLPVRVTTGATDTGPDTLAV